MSSIDSFIEAVVNAVVNPLVILIFVLGLALFLWGAVEFLWNSSSEVGKDTGKKHMMWGVIGMFIMASVGGIIALIKNTFGLP
jgi:phosphotransferase system  glucose/maltose/N-acetylglucosamine-specific IIC component